MVFTTQELDSLRESMLKTDAWGKYIFENGDYVFNRKTSELKTSIENFIYDPLEEVPIRFYYDKGLFVDDPIDSAVWTFSDLGGYWYLDDCVGTIWTLKLPRVIYELARSEGSSYKQTQCGHWTVDYNRFELFDPMTIYSDPFMDDSDDEEETWYKAIRAKIRKFI